MEKIISDVKLEFVTGDIASQTDMQAVVNAANAQLRIGGGVAGAIHRAAGSRLEKECSPLAPISPGEAVITGGYQLPNEYVIHCLGPVYGRDNPEDKLLADCYKNALELAEENEIKSIAFPAISTGAFGYPIEAATKVVAETILKIVSELDNIEKIRFVLYSKNDLDVYKNIYSEIAD